MTAFPINAFSVSEADAMSFVRARPRLHSIARRVLGSAADADDVVQDAWMRWQSTDRSEVRDPAAFLATTTTRLALNVGQSARARHETNIGASLFDAVDPAADPVRSAERTESLERAVWTILERLSPTERAVYVLREAFDYPHRRIASGRRAHRGQRAAAGRRAPAAGCRANLGGRSMPPSTSGWSPRSWPPLRAAISAGSNTR